MPQQDKVSPVLPDDVTSCVQDEAALGILYSLVSSQSEALGSPGLWQSLGPCLEHLLGGDRW